MKNLLIRQVVTPSSSGPLVGSSPARFRNLSARCQSFCKHHYHHHSNVVTTRYGSKSHDRVTCSQGIGHLRAHPWISACINTSASRFSFTARPFSASTNKFSPSPLSGSGPGSGPGPGSGFGKLSDTPPTDFAALDVLGDLQGPAAGVEVITSDGFKLSNGIRVAGAGVMLIGSEAFKWRPWLARPGDEDENNQNIGARKSTNNLALLRNARGQLEVHESCWGLLDLVWPKPDLLILGTGRDIVPLAPQTRAHINELGIRIEVLDTRNAAAQYMLLATERGTDQVAAALVPLS